MKIGLVLSGGGARGIMHLGVIKALHERGIKPSLLAGTSAGAIAGAMTAYGYTPDETLAILVKTNFLKYFRPSFSARGLLKMNRVESLYQQYLPHNSFEKLEIPLTITATDIEAGELLYFDKGALHLPLMATSCLPGIFEPIVYQQRKLVDGAVLNNLPIEPLQGQADFIIGVNCNPSTFKKPIKSLRGVLERSLLLAIRNKTRERLNQCDIFLEPMETSTYELYDIGKAYEIFRLGYKSVTDEKLAPLLSKM